jgi:hypothetical protein
MLRTYYEECNEKKSRCSCYRVGDALMTDGLSSFYTTFSHPYSTLKSCGNSTYLKMMPHVSFLPNLYTFM